MRSKIKSAKEKLIEPKILEKIQKYDKACSLVKFLFEDEELHEMRDYANIVSIKRSVSITIGLFI